MDGDAVCSAFSVFTSSSYVDFDLELREKRVIQTHHCHLSLIPQAYAGVQCHRPSINMSSLQQ